MAPVASRGGKAKIGAAWMATGGIVTMLSGTGFAASRGSPQNRQSTPTTSGMQRSQSTMAIQEATATHSRPAALMAAAGVALLATGIGMRTKLTTSGGRHAGSRANVKCSATFENEVGATEPLGYFDPLGLCQDAETFRKYRVAELKHGRVAMVASVGAVAQHFVRLPGFKFVDGTFGAVLNLEENGPIVAAAIFATAGAMELIWQEDPNKQPGDFGDPLGIAPMFGGFNDEIRNRELNNGRMAMFSVMGILAAELVTGKSAMAQFGF